MATKRIKDISTTATTFAADDFIALDASSVGTRKMAKASLITQVGATYLEKADNLSDVASKDTSKLNLEVPNVGSAANEVSVNGMLGDLAFQSSEGPNVSNLNATGTTTLTNDSDISLSVETTNTNAMVVNVIGASPNYIFDVRDDGSSKFRVDGNGNVVIGNIPTSATGLASGTVWSDSGTLKIV